MNKLLYISTGIPKEEVERLRKRQYNFQSNAMLTISSFHENILSGMSRVYDEVYALSGVPISHKNFRVLRYASSKLEKENVKHIMPGFFNFPVVKQITIIIKIFLYIIRWVFKNRKHDLNIIIDGTFYTGLISLWLASKVVKTKAAAIVVDYYPFMSPARENLSQKIYYKLIKAIDSFVFVTKQLEELINSAHKKYMIMEGLVSSNPSDVAAGNIDNCCVYAGGLHDIYGVRNLVDAFHESDLPYSLHLYGNGDAIDYIRKIEKTDARIVYKGVVSHELLLQIERGSKLLVNPRPVGGKLDTRYNFPSKLMEYMQSGRPVITTRLPGIPGEYDNYMFFFEGDTKEKIREGLEHVLSLDEKDLSSFGEHAKKYVNENKNNIVIAKKIFGLINCDGVENEKNL